MCRQMRRLLCSAEAAAHEDAIVCGFAEHSDNQNDEQDRDSRSEAGNQIHGDVVDHALKGAVDGT